MTYPITTTDQRKAAERLSQVPVSVLDPAASLLAEEGFCTQCGDEVTEVKDRLSYQEYLLSGLCQSCQDVVWGADGDAFEVLTDPAVIADITNRYAER